MHDDVAGVDQHPVGAAGAFDLHAADALLVELFLQMHGHGADLPVRKAGGDDHAVGEGGAAGEVDGDDFFGLVVLQAGDDDCL